MENEYTSSSALIDFVFEAKTTSRSAPSTRFMIAVNSKTITNTWIHDNQTQNLTQASSTRSVGKPIDLDTTMDPAVMHEVIATELGTWQPLPQQLRQQVIEKLFHRTMEMVKRNITSSAVCKILSRVDLTMHVYGDVMDRITQQSFEEEESVQKMVPASESSIKALLKRTILADNGSCAESCSVCMEYFLAGCQVLCMPCSHAFHQNCITKWLTSSHYCPNCRYRMPVEKM